jgi:hypothetical protein
VRLVPVDAYFTVRRTPVRRVVISG